MLTKQLHLKLLGIPIVTVDDAPVTKFISIKAQALLFYLAVTRRTHTREALATLFWPDMITTQAAKNLRNALSNLRKLADPYLLIMPRTVAFNVNSPQWLDIAQFHQHLTQAAGASDLAQWHTAIELYRGDFLEGVYIPDAPAFDEWVAVEREQWREHILGALQAVVAQHTIRREYTLGLTYVTRLLAMDPWREEAHRQKMQLLMLLGRRNAALAQYETCQRILFNELGVPPSYETRRLYETIRNDAMESEEASTHHAISIEPYRITARTAEVRPVARAMPHNVARPSYPLVGRATELGTLHRHLNDPQCRLVTVVGASGVGKTRLVSEVARQLVEVPTGSNDFPRAALSMPFDGVYFVALGAVYDQPSAILSAIAKALGLALQRDLSLKQQLLDYLQPKQFLLVLDQVDPLTALPALIEALLTNTTGVKLLVTARQPLHLPMEVVTLLAAFAITTLVGKNWRAQEAVKFFLQQAERVKPDSMVDAEEATAILAICHSVAGLPFGIELAAHLLHRMSCTRLARELAQSVRNRPAPDHPVYPLLDLVWHSCSNYEQEVLMHLAIFHGISPQRAALEISVASKQIVTELVAKALVRMVDPDHYELPTLVRQYLMAKQESYPALNSAARQRFCSYYAWWLDYTLFNPASVTTPEVAQSLWANWHHLHWAWEWANADQQTAAFERLSAKLPLIYAAYGVDEHRSEA